MTFCLFCKVHSYLCWSVNRSACQTSLPCWTNSCNGYPSKRVYWCCFTRTCCQMISFLCSVTFSHSCPSQPCPPSWNSRNAREKRCLWTLQQFLARRHTSPATLWYQATGQTTCGTSMTLPPCQPARRSGMVAHLCPRLTWDTTAGPGTWL